MNTDFNNCLSRLTADGDMRSKAIAGCLKQWPLVLSEKQKSLLSGQIKTLLKTLQHEIDSIDVNKKPNNKLWRYQGPISIADGLTDVQKGMKKVIQLLANDDSHSATYQTVIKQIESINRKVKELQAAQNQSAVVNWFKSRFPVVVR